MVSKLLALTCQALVGGVAAVTLLLIINTDIIRQCATVAGCNEIVNIVLHVHSTSAIIIMLLFISVLFLSHS